MKWQAAALLLAGAMVPAPGQAQSVGRDLETAGKDMVYIWSAPGRFKTGNLPKIGAVLGGTAALMLIDEPLYEWLSTQRKSLPGTFLGLFSEGEPVSFAGRSFVLGPVSLVLYGAGWGFDHPDLRQAGFGCVSSNLATTITLTAESGRGPAEATIRKGRVPV